MKLRIIVFALIIITLLAFSVTSLDKIEEPIIIKPPTDIKEITITEKSITSSIEEIVKEYPKDYCEREVCKEGTFEQVFYKKKPIYNGTDYLSWTEGVKMTYLNGKLLIKTEDGIECSADTVKSVIPTKTTSLIENKYEITNTNLTNMICNEKINWIIFGKTGTVSHYYFDLDPTFQDDDSTDWTAGTYDNTTTQDNKLVLSGTNLTGTFVSQIFDSTTSSSWDNITCDGLEGSLSGQSEGANGPSTTKTDNSNGGVDPWQNPNNVQVADSVPATIGSLSLSQTTDLLNASNFGFSIPSTSKIEGIIAEARVRQSVAGPNIIDRDAVLYKDGNPQLANDKATATVLTTSYVYRVYGGSTDLWSDTWTPDDINNNEFGFGWSARKTTSGTGLPQLDYMRITVYYSINSTVEMQVRSCNDGACSGETFSTDFTCDNTAHSLSIDNNQYFQYRINMSRDDSSLEPNVTSVNISYSILNTAPTVNLISPADQYSSMDTTHNFTFNFTDPEEDNASCELKINSVGFGINSTTLNNTNTIIESNTTISVGRYNWTITCDDGNSGITTSSQREIEILAIPPPHIEISKLEADDWYNDALWTNDLTPDVKATITGVYAPFNCTLLLNGIPKGSIGSIANDTLTTFTFNETLAYYTDYDNQLKLSCDNSMTTNNDSYTETIYTFNATGGGGGSPTLISCVSVLGAGCAYAIEDGCAVIN